MLRRSALLALAACTVLGATACSESDGRTLPPPSNHQTTTPVSSPVVGQPSEVDGDGVTEVFALFSVAFDNGQAIPGVYSCLGADLSPPLDWASAPPAAELALVVRDTDAAGFVHWVMTGIDPLVTSIGEDGVPEGAIEATNDTGTVGWAGPCPPAGPPHTYVFTLHALPEPLVIEPGAPPDEAALLVEGSSAGQAVLTGTFQR